jgi:hypothetical protein
MCLCPVRQVEVRMDQQVYEHVHSLTNSHAMSQLVLHLPICTLGLTWSTPCCVVLMFEAKDRYEARAIFCDPAVPHSAGELLSFQFYGWLVSGVGSSCKAGPCVWPV